MIPGKAHVEWEFRPVQNSDYDYVTGEVRRYVQETLLPEMQKNWPDANIVTETIGEVAGLEPMDTNEARDLVLALISGGGSALLTAPRPPLTLEDKIEVNKLLLA